MYKVSYHRIPLRGKWKAYANLGLNSNRFGFGVHIECYPRSKQYPFRLDIELGMLDLIVSVIKS
ncbi:hypothetical protein LCGC14_2495840 [marine sediment metagenome]|uniref:Uncharacterized protein n=1 Tax=marine sediment metagenome TaxID=412755 RepID=A0A0F9B446_9ZZZZ